MITPQKVFLSFMLMIALLPLPVLNSSIAFTLTWAVLGIRKALLVLAASMSYGAFIAGNFVTQLYASLMSTAVPILQQQVQCYATMCAPSQTTFNPSPILQLLKTDEIGLTITTVLAIYSIVQVFRRVKKIRAYSSSIRKFYWGPYR